MTETAKRIGKRAKKVDPNLADGLTLDQSQEEALNQILSFLEDPKKSEYRLGGYAGTGKTTLIKRVLNKLPTTQIPGVCSFTGKAVSVLRKKGVMYACTLHSLMYRPRTVTNSERSGERIVQRETVEFAKVDQLGVSVAVLDEASMVSTQLYEDLISFQGVKRLLVGDPGQLQPVGDDPRLMHKCDYVLTEIHRQAENSPILFLADHVRKGRGLRVGLAEYSPQSKGTIVVRRRSELDERALEVDQIICGFNRTRNDVNERVRRLMGISAATPLVRNEKLICLQNDSKIGVFNGQTLYVQSIERELGDRFYECRLLDDLENPYLLPVKMLEYGVQEQDQKKAARRQHFALCDYGYCVTCHKAQGSEWDKVLIINESLCRLWEPERWLYTALTRAAKEVEIIV